jgi:hypothetical protein
MNHFERIAIFTAIESIESQLRGVKTLLAASANNGEPAKEHKVTRTLDVDSEELSDDEEDRLHKEIKFAQEQEIERMRKSAESSFQNVWDETAKGMTTPHG